MGHQFITIYAIIYCQIYYYVKEAKIVLSSRYYEEEAGFVKLKKVLSIIIFKNFKPFK